MIGTHRSWHTDASVRATADSRKLDRSAVLAGTSFKGRRTLVALSEPEDALLTGMTRSLDRRLLALNLKPAIPASYTAPTLKVA